MPPASLNGPCQDTAKLAVFALRNLISTIIRRRVTLPDILGLVSSPLPTEETNPALLASTNDLVDKFKRDLITNFYAKVVSATGDSELIREKIYETQIFLRKAIGENYEKSRSAQKLLEILNVRNKKLGIAGKVTKLPDHVLADLEALNDEYLKSMLLKEVKSNLQDNQIIEIYDAVRNTPPMIQHISRELRGALDHEAYKYMGKPEHQPPTPKNSGGGWSLFGLRK